MLSGEVSNLDTNILGAKILSGLKSNQNKNNCGLCFR